MEHESHECPNTYRTTIKSECFTGAFDCALPLQAYRYAAEDPATCRGMNAAEWLCLVMLYPLNIPFDNFAAHFPRGPDIIAPRPYLPFAESLA